MKSSALDTFPVLSSRELRVLDGVDSYIESSLQEGTPHYIIGFLRDSQKAVQLTALGVSKALAALKQNWSRFQIEETWEEYVRAETGMAPATANNYARVWRQIFDNHNISEERREELASWPVSSLVDVSKAAEAGELDGHWDQILSCSNRSEVREALAEIRGQVISDGRLKIIWYRDGQLEAKEGDNRVIVGWLNPNEENEIVSKAVARIKNSSGMIEGV